MPVKARDGWGRILLGSGRTPAWDQAVAAYHAAHTTCEMCGSPAGPIGDKYDGRPGDQEFLEAHDVQPYHTLTDAQKNDEAFIATNLIVLHHFEHHRFAHACDPNWLLYNPNIRALAAAMLQAKQQCKK